MEIFLIMVPMSIILIGLAIWVFRWAVKSGQFDDLQGPAHSILFDDDHKMIPRSEQSESASEPAKRQGPGNRQQEEIQRQPVPSKNKE